MSDRDRLELLADLMRDSAMTFEHANWLIQRLHGQPHPLDDDARYSRRLDYDDIWNFLCQADFLDDKRQFGWIRPDGTFYGCSYAYHDKLIHLMGYTAHEVEYAGWVKVSMNRIRSPFKLTARQRLCLTRIGHVMDETEEKWDRTNKVRPTNHLQPEKINTLIAEMSAPQRRHVHGLYAMIPEKMKKPSAATLTALRNRGLIKANGGLTELGEVVGNRFSVFRLHERDYPHQYLPYPVARPAASSSAA